MQSKLNLNARNVPFFKNALTFIWHHVDYIIFLFLFMFKIYAFSRFTGIAVLDSTVLMISLGSALLISFWVLFLSRSKRIYALLAVDLIITAIVISDLEYFRYFSDVISIPVLFQVFQVSALGDSINTLIRIKDAYIIIDLVVLIPLGIYYARKIRHAAKPNALSRVMKGSLALALGFYLVYLPITNYVEKWGKNLFINNWANTSVVNVLGLFGFHGKDVYTYLDDYVFNKKAISSEEQQNIKAWFAQRQKENAVKTPLFGVAKGKNVIVIQVEAMQNFVINQSINGKEITPNLNKLVKKSVYFENYYHMVGQGRTSDADLLSNCSLHPLAVGSVFIRYPGNTYDCMPTILKQNGYIASAFHAYKPNFWNRAPMYQTMKYDHFYSEKDFVFDEKVGWALSDKSFLHQSLQKMKAFDTPFYAYLVTLSSHHPYIIPKQYHTLDLGKFEGTDFGNYIQSIHYADSALGSFLDELEKEGLMDKSVLAIYGDHDSGTLRDEGDMAALIGRAKDPYTYAKMQNQVPLIIHLPNDQAAGTRSYVGGQIDLTPTLLNLVGIPTDNRFVMGRNLMQEKQGLVALRYGSFDNGTVFYKNSVDQLFQNGTCYDDKTGQKTDINACRDGFNQTAQELKYSDEVILTNLLKSFKQAK